MDPGRTLIVIGAALVAAGVFWPWVGRIGLGRLPGDINNIERPGMHVYIPLATCLVIGAVLSLLFWLFRK